MAFIQKNILFGDHSEWGWSAEKEEVNKHPKFDKKFGGLTLISTLRICDDPQINFTFTPLLTGLFV